LWERRERARAQILTAVDAAEASLARGKGRVITRDAMLGLAEEVKQRSRARLSAEHNLIAARIALHVGDQQRAFRIAASALERVPAQATGLGSRIKELIDSLSDAARTG